MLKTMNKIILMALVVFLGCHSDAIDSNSAEETPVSGLAGPALYSMSVAPTADMAEAGITTSEQLNKAFSLSLSILGAEGSLLTRTETPLQDKHDIALQILGKYKGPEYSYLHQSVSQLLIDSAEAERHSDDGGSIAKYHAIHLASVGSPNVNYITKGINLSRSAWSQNELETVARKGIENLRAFESRYDYDTFKDSDSRSATAELMGVTSDQ